MNIKEKIYNLITNKKSIFLIGPTDSGKTWFAKNDLLLFLREKEMSVLYIQDCDHIPELINEDCAIIDEVEILQDKNFLETIHSDKKPYYSNQYITKTKDWFDKLRNIQLPCIYIITRNDTAEIQNLINIIKVTDWDNRAVECVEFKKKKIIKFKNKNTYYNTY